jgi:plasmid segregation protein ParM
MTKMKKIKAIDNGFLYTKDNEFNIFRSAFTKSGVTTGCTAFITIDGIDYSVGTGNRTTEFDKSDSEMNRVTTLTSLCMDGEYEYYLAVGLPIDQYAKQRDKFKKQIMGYNDYKVIYQGKEINIHIADVLVMPQSVGALLSIKEAIEGDAIILDFGGLTIDVAYVEIINGISSVQSFDTYTSGIQKIYPKVINVINDVCKTTHDAPMAEKFLKELDKGIYNKGEYQPADCLTPILRDYLDQILIEFELKYPAKNTKIYLCGGSALIFKDLLMERYPHAKLIPNSQFANAIGYYNVASQKFGELIGQQFYAARR